MAIGQTIYNQIGRSAFVMMDTKNIVALQDGLRWNVGRNSKKVTHVIVILDANNTYTVKFQRVWGCNVTDLAIFEGIYVEELHRIIEENTGLYLSLFVGE